MPAPRSLAVSLLASAMLLAAAAGSAAFSKLGREDGTVPPEDGVIATPLPPLSGAGAPSPTAAPGSAATPDDPDRRDPLERPNEAPSDDGPASTHGNGAVGPEDDAMPFRPAQDDASAEGAPQATGAAADDDAEGTDPAASQAAVPDAPAGPPPDVFYGDSRLPAPVMALRAKLLDVAKSGDIEKLRPFIETGGDGTVLSFGGVEGDPIAHLKSTSGDGEGVEVLAILLEVLQSGYTRNEPDTENEIYVWPYFSGVAIETLTKPQKVELFELVTAGDYQEMVGFGAYNFYRVGISPDGRLQFFVAGD